MTREYDGRRLVVNAGLVVAELAAFASAVVTWFLAGLTFFGDPLVRLDYLHMAVGFGLSGILLALGLVAMRPFDPAIGVTVLGAALAIVCGVAAFVSLAAAGSAPRGDAGEVWWWPFEFFLWWPTSWPMFVVILAGLVRALSGRGRQPQPAP